MCTLSHDKAIQQLLFGHGLRQLDGLHCTTAVTAAVPLSIRATSIATFSISAIASVDMSSAANAGKITESVAIVESGLFLSLRLSGQMIEKANTLAAEAKP